MDCFILSIFSAFFINASFAAHYGSSEEDDRPIPVDESEKIPYLDSRTVCTQPKRQGWCTHYRPRYYYDVDEQECIIFQYGGCYGNNNNFETEKHCLMTCSGVERNNSHEKIKAALRPKTVKLE